MVCIQASSPRPKTRASAYKARLGKGPALTNSKEYGRTSALRQQETVGGGRPLTPNRISGSAYKTRQYRFMHEAASGSDQESVTSDDESSDEDTDDIDDASRALAERVRQQKDAQAASAVRDLEAPLLKLEDETRKTLSVEPKKVYDDVKGFYEGITWLAPVMGEQCQTIMNAEKRYKDRVEDVAEGVKKVAVQAFEAVEIHLQRLDKLRAQRQAHRQKFKEEVEGLRKRHEQSCDKLLKTFADKKKALLAQVVSVNDTKAEQAQMRRAMLTSFQML